MSFCQFLRLVKLSETCPKHSNSAHTKHNTFSRSSKKVFIKNHFSELVFQTLFPVPKTELRLRMNEHNFKHLTRVYIVGS